MIEPKCTAGVHQKLDSLTADVREVRDLVIRLDERDASKEARLRKLEGRTAIIASGSGAGGAGLAGVIMYLINLFQK